MKKKICIVLGSAYPYSRGGDEILFTDIANRIIQERNWEFVVLCRKARRAAKPVIQKYLPYQPVSTLRSFPFGRLFEFIYLSYLDIVFFGNRVAGLRNTFLADVDAMIVTDPMVTFRIAKYSNRPKVVQFIGGSWADNLGTRQPLIKKRAKRIEKTAYRNADHLVVMDQTQSEVYDLPKGRFSVIPSGIDAQKYDKAKYDREYLRSHYGFAGKTAIITVASLRAGIKGHEYLIGAIPRIIRNHPNSHFYFAGKGSNEALMRLGQSMGVQAHIHFLGERQDVSHLLAASDVFVLPSLSEGTPRAILEAMASNLPCIATTVGGVPDIIENNENGLLVPAGDSDSIADAVIGLLDRPHDAERLGKNARMHILKHYDLSVTASKYIELIESLTGESN